MASINGWVNLNKDLGCTSLSCVTRIKRTLGAKKAGHFGTLDPLASGVLPVAIGEATKVIPYIFNPEKKYEFDIQFGEERATDDFQGEVISTSDIVPSIDSIKGILNQFIGDIEQIPPIFSAVKVLGKRSYDLARSGTAAPLKPRVVHVNSIELVSYDESNRKASFVVSCGSGTYVRSIARDIGQTLRCFGYASRISRVINGPFVLDNALDLSNISLDSVLEIDYPLRDMKKIELSAVEEKRIRSGGCLELKDLFIDENCDTYYRASRDGVVFAVCRLCKSSLSAVCVFNV